MIKLTINKQPAYFSTHAIRSITPHPNQALQGGFKSLIVIGDTEDCMFYVDETCDQVINIYNESFNN